MVDFLIYWKYYWQDTGDLNDDWYTEQAPFYASVRPGDNLWIVVTGGKSHPGEWRLLQKIHVERKRINRKVGRPYGVFGNRGSSERFDVESQPDFAPILQALTFISGKRITAGGAKIGNAIQKIRPLSDADSAKLKQYSARLTSQYVNGGAPDSVDFNDIAKDQETLENLVQRGAGFGDSETNRAVEKAAIVFVRTLYETDGWKVESVEAEKCGYDLRCSKGRKNLFLEVKGIKGSLLNFIITEGEVRRAKSEANFHVCAVTSALSRKPTFHCFNATDFLANFALSPLAYRATLRKP
jgi:hypothetical protein